MRRKLGGVSAQAAQDADVDRRIAALDHPRRTQLDLLQKRLTQVEIWHAEILNARDETSHMMGFSLRGQVAGLREAICILLGLDLEAADHEGPVHRLMNELWEQSGWAGWPG